jgi:hypothetical protein
MRTAEEIPHPAEFGPAAEIRARALALELAISGAIQRGIIDDGPLGRALEEAAAELSEKAMEL